MPSITTPTQSPQLTLTADEIRLVTTWRRLSTNTQDNMQRVLIAMTAEWELCRPRPAATLRLVRGGA